MKLTYTAAELAGFMDCSASNVRNQCRDGKIARINELGDCLRIPFMEVCRLFKCTPEQFDALQTTETTPEGAASIN